MFISQLREREVQICVSLGNNDEEFKVTQSLAFKVQMIGGGQCGEVGRGLLHKSLLGLNNVPSCSVFYQQIAGRELFVLRLPDEKSKWKFVGKVSWLLLFCHFFLNPQLINLLSS